MQNSAISFSVCIDNEANKVKELIQYLEKNYSIKTNEPVELITITNYTSRELAQLTGGKKLLIEQKTRNTLQLVVS